MRLKERKRSKTQKENSVYRKSQRIKTLALENTSLSKEKEDDHGILGFTIKIKRTR